MYIYKIKIPPQKKSKEGEVESSTQYPIYDHTAKERISKIREQLFKFI